MLARLSRRKMVLVLLAAMGIHLKTVELPRRAKSLVKERILDKAA